MDAIAFDPGFVGGKSTPPRMSASGGRSFSDFLPQDDPAPPVAPANKPRRSDTERSSGAESRDAADAAAAPVTDSPPANSPASSSGNSQGNSPGNSPGNSQGGTPPAATDAASDTPAEGAGEAAAAKPTAPSGGTAMTAPTPPDHALNAPTDSSTGTPAPGSTMPGAATAGAADMPAATAAMPPAAESGKPPAQPGTVPPATGSADPASQILPPDASAATATRNGSISGEPAPSATPQFVDAAPSDGAEDGLHAAARRGAEAAAQVGAQPPAAQTGPTPAAMAAAVAQAMDSAESGGAPEPLPFTVGDGDLAVTQASSVTSGTASQAAPGAMAAGGRPLPSAPMLAEQIAIHVQRGLQQGTDRIDIRLTPAELGRIEVRLELGQDGRVHAAIAVDRAETLELLQRDARGLERALQDAGLKTDSGGLTFNLRGEGRHQPDNGFAANETLGDSQSEPREPEIAADFSGRRVRLDGVIDIRV